MTRRATVIGMDQDMNGDGTIDIVTGYLLTYRTACEVPRLRLVPKALPPRIFTDQMEPTSNSGYETRENLTDRILEQVAYEYDLMGFLESVDRTNYGEKTERSLEDFTNDPNGERLTRRERSWGKTVYFSEMTLGWKSTTARILQVIRSC